MGTVANCRRRLLRLFAITNRKFSWGSITVLGWFKLSKGRHVLSFKCVGKDNLSTGYNLGVDGIVLAEIKNGEALVNSTGVGLPRYETVEDRHSARAFLPRASFIVASL